MSEKYIDLAPQIASMHDQPLGTMRVVLGLLDEFAKERPDQVPGRTITESEFDQRTSLCSELEAYWFKVGYLAAGGNIAPDPEPTNAEHDRAWWIENANVDAEDCEACGVEQDLCPVHHGVALGIEFVTKKIAALGDDPELFNSIPNPPKAPGANDDQ